MGPTWDPSWGRQDPGGHHVSPMNFAIWHIISDNHDEYGNGDDDKHIKIFVAFATFCDIKASIRWHPDNIEMFISRLFLM